LFCKKEPMPRRIEAGNSNPLGRLDRNPPPRKESHMKNKKFRAFLIALIAAASLSLAACGSAATSKKTTTTTATATTSSTSVSTNTTLDESDMYTDRDLTQTYDESEAINVNLSDGNSTCESSSVTVDNKTNAITITAEGVYVFSGSLSDGQIIVDAADDAKVEIVLKNASITNDTSAAIYVKNAKKTFITLADGTKNSLSTTGTFEADGDTNVDGVIFSKEDLTIKGTGSLTVNSAEGHGIVGKDDLVITGGTISVTAAKKGIAGKDSIRVNGGEITVDAQDDGFHSGNDDDASKGWTYISGGQITIASKDDGIHADSELRIVGGEISVTQSNEGLESQVINIIDGTINIVSSDDGLNASSGSSGNTNQKQDPMAGDDSCVLNISGGTLTIDAGGDGVDSNGSLNVSGGSVYVSGPTDNGNAALDSGTSSTITGGTVIAAGSSGMAENFGSDSTQGSMLVSTENGSGTITLTDSDGNVLASFTPTKSYSCAVISTPDIALGGTYTVTYGAQTTSVTMDSSSYIYSNVSGGMGGKGGPGGMGGQGASGDQGGQGAPGGQGGQGAPRGQGGPGQMGGNSNKSSNSK